MSINIVFKNNQKADAFAGIFQHMKLFTDRINIMFERERLYIQSMDSARVSIFEIHIPAEWFDKYEFTVGGGRTIGINSTMLYRILSTRDKLQEMQLLFEEANDDKLSINFTSETKAVFDKSFEMHLFDIEAELMEIPPFETKADFSISSANFANIIGQLKMFGDSLDIECNDENILLTSVSQESGKMVVKINIDDLTSYAISEDETMNISFSLVSLHNICMYNKIAKDMEISLTDQYPMKIVYSLEDTPKENGARLVFYLAPKISD
jgi:proliferating cell nuclear antigen PCNA